MQLPLLVVNGSGPSLLGRDWLAQLKLDWQSMHNVHSPTLAPSVQIIIEKHSQIFQEELGTIQGTTAKLQVEESEHPHFFKPRSVPLALKTKVEAELERLVEEGIVEPVNFSEWAAPIVPVMKGDGSIRICGDYKLMVNRGAKADVYPIPSMTRYLHQWQGEKILQNWTLSHAYQQLLLDQESKKYTTINTHKGIFQYNRLPFGVSAAPAIFQ